MKIKRNKKGSGLEKLAGILLWVLLAVILFFVVRNVWRNLFS